MSLESITSTSSSMWNKLVEQAQQSYEGLHNITHSPREYMGHFFSDCTNSAKDAFSKVATAASTYIRQPIAETGSCLYTGAIETGESTIAATAQLGSVLRELGEVVSVLFQGVCIEIANSASSTYTQTALKYETFKNEVLPELMEKTARQYEIIKERSLNFIETNKEPIQNKAEELVRIALTATKIVVGTLFALSMSSLFFAGSLYGYFDKKGSRELINDLVTDWNDASIDLKVAVVGFGIIAWPGTLAVGAFLMGAHTAHTIQDRKVVAQQHTSVEAQYEQVTEQV